MRDQSDFRFSDHQVCLETKQLKENKKFYFVYKSVIVPHKKEGGEIKKEKNYLEH
jgi:hypothetical protein